jgi:hypothetical protein
MRIRRCSSSSRCNHIGRQKACSKAVPKKPIVGTVRLENAGAFDGEDAFEARCANNR